MEYTVAQLAYFAGLLDGEGCLHVCDKKKCKRKSRGIRKTSRIWRDRVNFSTALTIANCNLEVLEWLVENFGGFIQTHKKKFKEHWDWKRTWHIRPIQIYPILKLVLPYLIIKKKQAILMLEARKIIDANTRRMEHTQENYDRLLQIAQHIKLLNKKDPSALLSPLSSEEFQVNHQ